MEKAVSIYEAKTQLSKLLELVANGETVTITNRGKPVATLNPILSSAAPVFGFLKDQLPKISQAEWEQSDAEVSKLFKLAK